MLIYAYLPISLLPIIEGETYQIHPTHLLLNQVLPSLDSSYPVSISSNDEKKTHSTTRLNTLYPSFSYISTAL
jgi:hypothetical protein